MNKTPSGIKSNIGLGFCFQHYHKNKPVLGMSRSIPWSLIIRVHYITNLYKQGLAIFLKSFRFWSLSKVLKWFSLTTLSAMTTLHYDTWDCKALP